MCRIALSRNCPWSSRYFLEKTFKAGTIRYRRPDVAPYPLVEKIGEGGMGVATAARPDVSCFAKPRFFAERMKNRSWKCRGLKIPRANARPGSNPGSGTILAWP